MSAIGPYPLLRVDGLTKRYSAERAIDDAAFSAFPGEILGIIGPNGAGKTTLMEAAVGLVSADSGEVLWRGEPLPASRRRNALFYLPDGVRPYQDQVTADVISFFAGVYRRSVAEIDAIVSSVGLKSVLHKRVGALSKGYNRRLLLSLGLLTPHELLLMDEPFDGFDLRQTRNIIAVLRHHAEGGRTFVLAIHELADAERICDRFVLLAGGQVRGSGTLEELREATSMPSGSLEDIFLALT
ncbi:ABC-2 type transport system ATP-binding protein [Bradyrhizobium brasilense]|uniref:ABC-2 type transport system ATP-binding protein n=1 Tax=Bradyrhizobium brasilense TaxID=1419277 RepID=A0A1G7Q0A9_9BRAD|nr:ABC transporter ATP-binding protein [Bradyrhizobium brasilense]SDF91934.1 ABC-2 type transport system ATP-binding protein [Bradyrhizobium brasilense]